MYASIRSIRGRWARKDRERKRSKESGKENEAEKSGKENEVKESGKENEVKESGKENEAEKSGKENEAEKLGETEGEKPGSDSSNKSGKYINSISKLFLVLILFLLE